MNTQTPARPEPREVYITPEDAHQFARRLPSESGRIVVWFSNGIHPETIAENALRLVGMLNARTGAK